MKQNRQLNSIILAAQNGCVASMWEVKYRFSHLVHTLSEDNRNHIKCQHEFEDECFKVIEETVALFEPSKGDFPQLLYRCLTRRLARAKERYKNRTSGFTVVLLPTIKDESDGYVEVEIIDDLAIVDKNISLNERITGLAAGDPRKVTILKSWTEPDYCESDTALLLAKQFGGKSETHRKAITRFRTHCQKALVCAN
ncbi:hypothetical protein [Paenibacillus terrae]|uniref:hypothetical protein n=1 Tax=Paenibacillus terrae TaxID=159743 RepID=UPI0011EADB7B|nr:hypothetical protein [Paenibacillus terrae]